MNESSIENIESIVYNNTAVEPAPPTKEGHSFIGWFEEGAETPFDFDTPITKHITLTAQYEINDYTLTFNTDGGTLIDPIIQEFGSELVAPANPTKEGHTFVGWSPALPATIPAINQTYTALWDVNEYTITFNVNGGDAVSPQTYDFGATLSLPIPTKTDENFAGWFTDEALTIAFSGITMPSNSFTLYASWTTEAIDVTVSFESNGGSSVEDQVVELGSTITEPTPTRTGYDFVGWFTDVELTTPWVFSNSVTADMTLYAGWSIKVYEIVFVGNGGTPATQTIDANHGQTLSQTPTTPSRSGYDFVGWFDTDALSGGNEWSTETTFVSTVIYYARWTEVVLEDITITLTEQSIWTGATGSYAAGNFEKAFSGMTIKADDSGFYTGNSYTDNKIQVRKNYGWIYNTDIPEGYIIKSVTVNGQTSGLVNIFFSTTTIKPTSDTHSVKNVSTSGDVSSNEYLYFYIKENNTQSGTVTIDSIVIVLTAK